MYISDCIGDPIIAWLTYNTSYTGPENRVCYIYPRYVRRKDSSYDIIQNEEMHDSGRIDVYLPRETGLFAEGLCEEKGSLVSIRLTKEPTLNEINARYPSVRYNPAFGNSSEIIIDKFNGRGLIQIIRTTNDFAVLSKTQYIELLDIGLFTNELLIEAGGDYYGPFSYDYRDGKAFLSTQRELQYYARKFSADMIDTFILNVKDETNATQILFLPKENLETDSYEELIDWISEDKLVENLTSSLKTSDVYSKNQVRQIRNSLSEIIKLNDEVELTPERQQRLTALLDMVVQRDDFLINTINYVFETPELSASLVKLVCNEYFDQIEEKSRDFSNVKKRLSELQFEAENVQKRLDQLREDESLLTTEAQAKQNDSVQGLANTVDALKVEIEQLNNEKHELQKYIDEAGSISELSKRKDEISEGIRRAQEELDRYTADKTRLEDQLKRTLHDFDEQAKVIARSIDNKLLNQVLRTVGNEDHQDQNQNFSFDNQFLLKSDNLSGKSIIERVGSYIRDVANRNVTDNDVANYLICIMQGFITTFAGEPGTGKTSLCNILAKALGLARTDTNSRFIDISVERGWTSHKDFIGYYNPLTKMMEKSNHIVFDALARLNDEFSNGVDAPFFILLDEANLSPIEHYWAAFLKLCDPESSHSRAISLGGKHAWKIPEYLRFLATVNFDHTTEELSPRYLDRSWIITLNPHDFTDESMTQMKLDNLETIIPYSEIHSAFVANSDREIRDEIIRTKWYKIQSIYRNNSLPIMPRNLKMIHSYCSKAIEFMDTQTPESRYAPLDYAVSQKVLPLINGTGDHYRKLLTELQEECVNMPLCSSHLSRMLRLADENMGIYQFFAK